ncbi:acetylcholine receptor subunit alpha-type acr-16-like [Pollicipes pollicipes]|uniref:acetylcholine receptor subunit alpha-type acr-16-like n=1 Tax=Pollicipes pollicipes TaxID=41117 RepID=UPI0018855A1D|nr:acetylcholine receptor subunit alpha-type acr-16-like [Pollicipes pollicipes]
MDVTVLLGLSLTNVEVDVSRSAVTVSGWLNIGWKNPALSWTSDNSVLKNIERTYLHMDQMWIPDMRPINMLDIAKSWFGKTVALVWRDGRAHLGLPVTISFRCKNTVTDDSDQFRCPITIGPWVHSVDEVDVQPASDTVDVSHIVASGAWRVARSSVVRREVTYACCPREFAMLDMELILRPQYC